MAGLESFILSTTAWDDFDNAYLQSEETREKKNQRKELRQKEREREETMLHQPNLPAKENVRLHSNLLTGFGNKMLQMATEDSKETHLQSHWQPV